MLSLKDKVDISITTILIHCYLKKLPSSTRAFSNLAALKYFLMILAGFAKMRPECSKDKKSWGEADDNSTAGADAGRRYLQRLTLVSLCYHGCLL